MFFSGGSGCHNITRGQKSSRKNSWKKKALRAVKYEESDSGLWYFEEQDVGGEKECLGRLPLWNTTRDLCLTSWWRETAGSGQHLGCSGKVSPALSYFPWGAALRSSEHKRGWNVPGHCRDQHSKPGGLSWPSGLFHSLLISEGLTQLQKLPIEKIPKGGHRWQRWRWEGSCLYFVLFNHQPDFMDGRGYCLPREISHAWWTLCQGKLDHMFTASSTEYTALLQNICCQILRWEISSARGFIKQHGESFASKMHLNIDVFVGTDVCLLPAQCVIRLEILEQQP